MSVSEEEHFESADEGGDVDAEFYEMAAEMHNAVATSMKSQADQAEQSNATEDQSVFGGR